MQVLSVVKRNIRGKKVKMLRKNGYLPAVVYGHGIKSAPIEVKAGDFVKLWKKAGESTLVELDLDGENKKVLIADVQLDPVSDSPIHADFHAVRMDEKIRARVPIEFVGEPPAVKNLGAVLVKVMRDIEVEALPVNLPGEIAVDISGLANFDEKVFVKNLKRGGDFEFIADPDEVVVLVAEPKKEEEAPVEAPGIESIEVAEKGKKEKEGEELAATTDEKA